MKIRFPEIHFGFRIHPKPRGNWRPKVEMWLSVEVKDGEFTWRPWVPGVIFGHPTLIENRGKYLAPYSIAGIEGWRFTNSFNTYVKYLGCSNRAVYRVEKGEVLLPIFDVIGLHAIGLHLSPKKGEGGWKAGIQLWEGGYWTPGTRLNSSWEFYLEWRPGQKPDYSDYARAFQLIPRVLIELFKDGLDSGVSDEISFEFRGRVVKKRHTPTAPKEGQGLTWM